MMGIQEKTSELFSYQVNLDKRVRQDHPLRKIANTIDFTFARQEVAHVYGYNGNESVDPAIIMKMMFLLFYDNVRSERELMKVIPERLDYMWFLGYGLDDTIPNHSVLSKARRRWGPEVFEDFFARIIATCMEAGLVDGRKIHVDGSLVDANASNNAVVKGSPELIEQLKECLGSEIAKLDEPQTRRKKYYTGQNKKLLNTTDPDASMIHQGKGKSKARYKTHRVVDDAKGAITAIETTPGEVEENARLMDLIDQHERNTDQAVGTVVADSQYGTVDNFRKCHERGIRSHMADLLDKQKEKGKDSEIFNQEQFEYNAETDTYMCPAGQILTRRKHKMSRNAYEYACKGSICKACSLRSQCSRAKNGTARTIKRHYNQEAVDTARAQSRSGLAKRDRKRRKWLMEGSFANGANNHGFKRSRWRRLWRQQIQDYMIAAIQNVKILINHLEKDRKAAMACISEKVRGGFQIIYKMYSRIFLSKSRYTLSS
jgi:transposase